MKKFIKAFLALLVMCTCIPLMETRVEAEEFVTKYLHIEGISTPLKMKFIKGYSLYGTFKAHPEFYDQICQYDTANKTPVFYSGWEGDEYNYRINPHDPVFFGDDSTFKDLYVRFFKPIHEVHLSLKWPTVGESSSGYYPVSMDSGANYTVTDFYLMEVDENAGTHTPDWSGKFKEGYNYSTVIDMKPKAGYHDTIISGKMKIYLNGVLLDDSIPSFMAYYGGKLGFRFNLDLYADKKVGQFVDRMYNLCLGRKPDTNGYNNWVTSLMLKKKAAAQIVSGFFNSTEFKNKNLNDEKFVDLCYRVMFDRSADAGGKKNWLDKLANGVSRNYVLNGFVGSVEFHKLCAKYGITAGTIKLTEARDQNYNLTSFVARMYDLVLGRKFDVPGLNNWCKKVLDAKDRRSAIIDMAFGFFHSKEFLNMKTKNSLYVQILYRVFFDRSPDYAGWDDWVNKLNAGMSRDQVLLGFANSAEFTNVLKKFKLL